MCLSKKETTSQSLLIHSTWSPPSVFRISWQKDELGQLLPRLLCFDTFPHKLIYFLNAPSLDKVCLSVCSWLLESITTT